MRSGPTNFSNLPRQADIQARLRTRLLARIRRQFVVVSERVEISPHVLEFTRIADPDQVLDAVAQEEDRLERLSGRPVPADQLHLPYWAELWDSAFGLALHLSRAGDLAGQLILDLGCGMGLSGTMAARMGARVLFADLEAAPLLFARLNSLPDAQNVRTRRLDWRKDVLEERFDRILGADILYEKTQWEHLDRFWRQHLREKGEVLLGEPGRQTGDLFIPWVQERGWKLEPHQQPVATRQRAIRIFRLTSG